MFREWCSYAYSLIAAGQKERFHAFSADTAGRKGRQVKMSFAGFDPVDIEQVVEDMHKALALFPSGEQQVSLLPVEVSCMLLEQEVDGHSQCGQRCAQLV